MSIRLRLAFWYSALFALVILLITLVSYAVHTRGHYDDLDHALVASVSHTATEVSQSTGKPDLVGEQRGLEMILRLYNPDGVLQDSSPDNDVAPTIDPRIVLRSPAGPAFDPLAGLAPPLAAPALPAGGAFGLVATSAQRWRVYVLPLQRAGIMVDYVEGLTPLGWLDAGIQTFRLLLPAVGLLGLVLGIIGSWAIAGRALRPIARMAQTGRAIARSHDFTRRIDVPPRQDELGYLAATFNTMLESLEVAYRGQQRFVADASHELRAPLTAIQANLDLLRRHQEMPEQEKEEALIEAEREAVRLTRLVADLLVLARADAGGALKRHPVDLDSVVLEAFREARQLSQGQQVTLEPFEPLRMSGDEDRLKQVVLILLDNALKYTPPDGQVTLGLRRRETRAEILVQDTGMGIAPEDMPQVFERFYRADKARGHDPGGTGLGLAIARWIVEQHGGEIALQSQPGQGTLVTVSFPLEL
jgi:signal transduction histidine kinase